MMESKTDRIQRINARLHLIGRLQGRAPQTRVHEVDNRISALFDALSDAKAASLQAEAALKKFEGETPSAFSKLNDEMEMDSLRGLLREARHRFEKGAEGVKDREEKTLATIDEQLKGIMQPLQEFSEAQSQALGEARERFAALTARTGDAPDLAALEALSRTVSAIVASFQERIEAEGALREENTQIIYDSLRDVAEKLNAEIEGEKGAREGVTKTIHTLIGEVCAKI